MASPSAREKGKGRAIESQDGNSYFDANPDDDETGATGDYHTALESALYDTSNTSRIRRGSGTKTSSSSNGNGSNGHLEKQDDDNQSDDVEEDERFVYDGEDDEDVKEFREDAKMDSLSYGERLQGVLGDANELASTDGDVGEPPTPRPAQSHITNSPKTSTPTRSRRRSTASSTSSTSQSSPTLAVANGQGKMQNGAESPDFALPFPQTLSTDQTFPRPRARRSSVSSAASSQTTSDIHQASTSFASSPQSQRFSHLAPRRPPMNPLVSRLRSTSTTPSQSFRGVRSVSQASSLASLAAQGADAKHGFANESFALEPGTSFASGGAMHTSNLPISASESRRSSFAGSRDYNGNHSRTPVGATLSPSMSSDAFNHQEGDATAQMPEATFKAHLVPDISVHDQVPPLKWTVLKRITQRLFTSSHANGRTMSAAPPDLGSPTSFAVSGGLIVIGTGKGWVAVYDYAQSLKTVLGSEDILFACGGVTAVALSQDSTYIAVAYQSGHIHLYEWGAKPGVPARTVKPVTLTSVNEGKAEGHLVGDNNLRGSEILYLGFVGRRHTAIVSGDQYGLAFYHSLGKVLGLANTDILRILGKYPATLVPQNAPNKGHHLADPDPTTSRQLLALQPLPLGTEDNFADQYNLTALLTPNKLVIAGLKPSPRTWWRFMHEAKAPSPQERRATERSAYDPKIVQRIHLATPLMGCLAWLPSVETRNPYLAFSWSRHVYIVSVRQAMPATVPKGRSSDELRLPNMASGGKNAQGAAPVPDFALSRRASEMEHKEREAEKGKDYVYSADEDVTTLQWYNRQVLAIFTSQSITLFDTEDLQVIERCDAPGIPQLRTLDVTQYRIYKAKIFAMVRLTIHILAYASLIPQQTSRDIRAGSLLSWADRVLALVSSGNLVAAIDLLVLYHGTSKDSVQIASTQKTLSLPFKSLGLPWDADERRSTVEPKLLEVLVASTDYAFSEDRMKDDTHRDLSGNGRGVDRTELFEGLVDAVVRASISTNSYNYLFDDLFERFSDNGIEGIYLDRLKPFVLAGRLRRLPVLLTQQLVERSQRQADDTSETEQLIYNIDTDCLDVNQAVSVCSKHRLYNALIYIYTKALNDFVGPLVNLLDLIHTICTERRDRSYRPTASSEDLLEAVVGHQSETLVPYAYTAFAYLADSLVGLAHPSQEPLSPQAALQAKRTLYSFLFSTAPVTYPPGSLRTVPTTAPQNVAFPYLRLLLAFDAEGLLDCLDIAFEDSYLDEDAKEQGTPDRQDIIQILLTVREAPTAPQEELSTNDRTFLTIFIARNVPKYRQYIDLPEATKRKIFRWLVEDQDLSSQHDRELALEYLLSSWSPKYDEKDLRILETAGFHRILASIYRSKRSWPALAAVYMAGEEFETEVFSLLGQVLGEAKTDDHSSTEVQQSILENITHLVGIDVVATAQLIRSHMHSKQAEAVKRLKEVPLRQMAYLRALLEPDRGGVDAIQPVSRTIDLPESARYAYIDLLSEYDPGHVPDFYVKDSTLDERTVLRLCEQRQNYQAIIWIQARAGRIEESMNTLRTVLEDRSAAFIAHVYAHDGARMMDESIQEMALAGSAAIAAASQMCQGQLPEQNISHSEVGYRLLLSLIDTVKNVARSMQDLENTDRKSALQVNIWPITNLVPDALSAFLSASTTQAQSLPNLVRRLMEASKDATYSQYKPILDGMLELYQFELDLLETSTHLLEQDLHERVAELAKERSSGWRPDVSGTCEACGRSVWTTTSDKERIYNLNRVSRSISGLEVSEVLKSRPRVKRRPSLKGKETDWYEEVPARTGASNRLGNNIVVFRGGAVCHATCLERGSAYN